MTIKRSSRIVFYSGQPGREQGTSECSPKRLTVVIPGTGFSYRGLDSQYGVMSDHLYISEAFTTRDVRHVLQVSVP